MLHRLCLATLPLAAALAAPSASAADYGLPPYVHAYEPTTVDERGLWMEADENERIVRDSALLMRDENLSKYVKKVLCDTVGEDRCRGVRVYVLEVPQFNASMTANGTMRVWTGMLLRVQNEAELASVLGHEFAHFELRHTLNGYKQRRGAGDVAAWLTVLGAGANMSTGLLQTALVGSMFRYSREQEAQADLLGLKYLGNSPYPPKAAADIWKYMMAENDARTIGRGQKPKRDYAAGFFDTHPANFERATYLAAEAAKLGKEGDLRTKEYREVLRPFLPQLLAAQVKSNDFGGTEYLLQTMSGVEGWTGDLLFARGSLYRQRANPRDLATAASFFREAIGKGYANPVAYRELGLSLLRNGEQMDGRAALQQYLSLSPNASDKGVISSLVAN